jgi:hypothetical protein
MISITEALNEMLEDSYSLDGHLGVENFGKKVTFNSTSGNMGEDTDPELQDNNFIPNHSSIYKSRD